MLNDKPFQKGKKTKIKVAKKTQQEFLQTILIKKYKLLFAHTPDCH